ncbi:hydantoinase B/oxoprolinase family protein [Micromonospora craniellae]|uniref:Hydantoinase B/oxoprolinase family protein n=1 Tax=Micromonospora craniellae TaxID=2294034 RepID=A0A372FUH8_9ACTN|nr:hydantoinase B/oxoprolinase family protein [Micromonospora craniellae]QOC92329.1 hydantoinase B/oxoprolinase family protein [Micromonospora craniellae]RFS44119.1 hydantoinase B/oxoprolinase family protein [Micromonospora craniellae]
MSAVIVETTRTQRPVEVETAVLDIVENALRNARFEMDAVVLRTAMSPGIREQNDAFPLIADRKGRMVAGQFGSFIDGFLSGYDGTVEEGDVFFTSDPYACDGAISHANDWLVLLPIYFDGALVGWAAMFGHMSDVGGKVPGSLPTDAVSIYEEGVIVPPVKLFRGGTLDQQLLDTVLNQVRLPNWNRADLNAVLASCRTAETRVRELCERFGLDTYLSTLDLLLERNRQAMAKLFRQVVPEQPVTFEDYIDDDGRGAGPFRIRCTLWRDGDRVVLDFTGTSDQAEGSINFLLNENVLRMFFGVYTIMAVDPLIMFNDGFYPLVDVRIPEGSLLKPRRPAALSCRTHALGRLFDVLAGLLGQCQPDFLCAAGFSSSPHLMYSGLDRSGTWFQLYQIGFGGVPARPIGDGFDGHSMWPSFTNVPNEYLEAYYPLRIESYESIPDSGGAGRHRGGNGIRVGYRFLEPGQVSIHDDRWFTKPWGVLGGEPGQRGTKILERADGSRQTVPAKCDHVGVRPGDLLHFVTWGGGGWGDPLERDPDQVRHDVERGLVTVEGARRYGVVLVGDRVDDDQTRRLRAEIAASRSALPRFHHGGTVEELRARCLTETGLEPPREPAPSRVPVEPTGTDGRGTATARSRASAAPERSTGPRTETTVRTPLEVLVHRIARQVTGR